MRRLARAAAIDPLRRRAACSVPSALPIARPSSSATSPTRTERSQPSGSAPAYRAARRPTAPAPAASARSVRAPAPRPPPTAADPVDLRPHFGCAASAGAADSPTRAQHRQVEQVVAHVARRPHRSSSRVGENPLVGRRACSPRPAPRSGSRAARRGAPSRRTIAPTAARPSARRAAPRRCRRRRGCETPSTPSRRRA